jgi:hypothetical protein
MPNRECAVGKYRTQSGASTPKAFQIVQTGQLFQNSLSKAGDGILNNTVRITRDLALAEDRRGSRRHKIRVPLTVILEDREIQTYTRDLSSRGVYFYLAVADSALIDSNLQFLVDFPAEGATSTECRIRCKGRLVRREQTSRNVTETGLAAEILEYSLLGDGR